MPLLRYLALTALECLLKQFVLTLTIVLFASNLFAQGVKVKDLNFEANHQISDGKLRAAIQTATRPWYAFFLRWMTPPPFDEATFLTDLLRIEKFYHQEGFLQAKVSDYKVKYNDKQDKVELLVVIDEGEPTKVSTIDCHFLSDSSDGLTPQGILQTLRLKSGKHYREADLKADYEQIVKKFSNHGYPYVEARVRPHFRKNAQVVSLEWLIDPGPFCYFGDIHYTGNEHVSNGAIRRGLGFSEGEPFAQNKLANAQTQVYRLELFQFVSLQATNLEDRPTQIPIEVKVKEATLRTLKFGFGYGTEEQIRASAQWRHLNFFGGARILRVNAKRSGLLPVEVETELRQPYFLSNKNDLILKPFFRWEDNKSFEERSIGAEVTLNRRLTPQTSAFFSTIVEKDTVQRVSADTTKGNATKSILRIGLTHSSTDEVFTPTQGNITSILVEEAGRFLSTPSKYLKVYFQHRLYTRIDKHNTLALKIAAGSMKPIRGSAFTPIEERFFAGGSYSVRGWGRQALGPYKNGPLGGDSILEGSIELRRTIYKQFAGAAFLDFGNVWQKWNGFDLTDLHYAAGIGIRYNTPIGPLRIDLAARLNKQKRPTPERDLKVHLSIGQAF